MLPPCLIHKNTQKIFKLLHETVQACNMYSIVTGFEQTPKASFQSRVPNNPLYLYEKEKKYPSETYQ